MSESFSDCEESIFSRMSGSQDFLLQEEVGHRTMFTANPRAVPIAALSNDSARLAAKRELQEFIEIQQIFVDQKNDKMNAFLQGLQQSQYLQSPTCQLAKKKKATGLFAPRLDLNSFHIMSKKSGHEYTSRIPSTCDQILFATRSPAAFGLIGNMISFQSVSMTQSDHAALVAFFKVALP